MGTYIVGDIHGCLNEWIELKEKIEGQDKSARFILVGDIIDRGNQSLDMIKWAMKNIEPDGKYQMVIGNHEDMKIDLWYEYCTLLLNKNDNALEMLEDFDEYDFYKLLMGNKLSFEEIDEIIMWFLDLPLYIEVDVKQNNKNINYIIVHAGINGNINSIFKDNKLNIVEVEQNYERFREHALWKREVTDNTWDEDIVIVHGHTPTNSKEISVFVDIPGKIHKQSKDINVDCGMVYRDTSSNLGAIRLEDLEEFYLYEK